MTVGENDRLADRLLYDRARQVMILLRNNIVLNVRVQEAEARAAEAERKLAEAFSQARSSTGTTLIQEFQRRMSLSQSRRRASSQSMKP